MEILRFYLIFKDLNFDWFYLVVFNFIVTAVPSK